MPITYGSGSRQAFPSASEAAYRQAQSDIQQAQTESRQRQETYGRLGQQVGNAFQRYGERQQHQGDLQAERAFRTSERVANDEADLYRQTASFAQQGFNSVRTANEKTFGERYAQGYADHPDDLPKIKQIDDAQQKLDMQYEAKQIRPGHYFAQKTELERQRKVLVPRRRVETIEAEMRSVLGDNLYDNPPPGQVGWKPNRDASGRMVPEPIAENGKSVSLEQSKAAAQYEMDWWTNGKKLGMSNQTIRQHIADGRQRFFGDATSAPPLQEQADGPELIEDIPAEREHELLRDQQADIKLGTFTSQQIRDRDQARRSQTLEVLQADEDARWEKEQRRGGATALSPNFVPGLVQPGQQPRPGFVAKLFQEAETPRQYSAATIEKIRANALRNHAAAQKTAAQQGGKTKTIEEFTEEEAAKFDAANKVLTGDKSRQITDGAGQKAATATLVYDADKVNTPEDVDAYAEAIATRDQWEALNPQAALDYYNNEGAAYEAKRASAIGPWGKPTADDIRKATAAARGIDRVTQIIKRREQPQPQAGTTANAMPEVTGGPVAGMPDVPPEIEVPGTVAPQVFSGPSPKAAAAAALSALGPDAVITRIPGRVRTPGKKGGTYSVQAVPATPPEVLFDDTTALGQPVAPRAATAVASSPSVAKLDALTQEFLAAGDEQGAGASQVAARLGALGWDNLTPQQQADLMQAESILTARNKHVVAKKKAKKPEPPMSTGAGVGGLRRTF